MESHESKVLRLSTSTLNKALASSVNLRWYTDCLFEDGLISQDDCDLSLANTSMSKYERARTLTKAVISRVATDKDAFRRFIAVLQEEPSLGFVVDNLLNEYRKHCPDAAAAIEDKPLVGVTNGEVLSESEIVKELGGVTDWAGLGAQLGISDDTLQQIECDYPRTQDRLNAVINHWISSKARNSWAVFNNALERCGYHVLAGRLHVKFHLSSRAPQETAALRSRPVHRMALSKVWLISFVVFIGIALVLQQPLKQTVPQVIASCHPVDVCNLEKELAEIGNWEILCDLLGVPASILQDLRMRHLPLQVSKSNCLQEYVDGGDACWEEVVQVIASYPFHNKRLAKAIAHRHNINTEKEE